MKAGWRGRGLLPRYHSHVLPQKRRLCGAVVGGVEGEGEGEGEEMWEGSNCYPEIASCYCLPQVSLLILCVRVCVHV